MADYDLAVIGAGPGGYKCALRAAKLGLKVACIDKNDLLGGTCLRVGCIPSKALLDYSYKYHAAKELFPRLGIISKDVKFDIDAMFKARDAEMSILSSGIKSLFSTVGVRAFQGVAKVVGKSGDFFKILVCCGDQSREELAAKNVVIATGSEVSSLPNLPIDNDKVISSDAALHMDVPKKLIVVGAGAIGLEMSSIWSRLGAEVTVIEYSDRIAAGSDKDVSKALLDCLTKQGIKFCLSSRVASVSSDASGVVVEYESVVDGSKFSIKADKVLVAVGRAPNVGSVVDNLELDSRGFIVVDENYETSIRGIYAIGDVIGGHMLAHKAEMEGCVVVDKIAMGAGAASVDYAVIPSIIYTHPAIASVGKAEQHLESVGYAYKTGKCNFAANGRSRITYDSDGFVKVIVCKTTNIILGVHIIGAHADVMINEAAVALGYRATASDIYNVCHSHPDVNEAFRDACEAALHVKS